MTLFGNNSLYDEQRIRNRDREEDKWTDPR
jgi:hypothetical protein